MDLKSSGKKIPRILLTGYGEKIIAFVESGLDSVTDLSNTWNLRLAIMHPSHSFYGMTLRMVYL